MMDREAQQGRKAGSQALALWLLLLTVLTHATVPIGSPLHRSNGSAFSATTADVSLAPKRKNLGAEQASVGVPDDDGGSGGAGSADPVIAAAAINPTRLWHARSGAGSRDFPLAERDVASFNARAPPNLIL